jgi:formylglycine-generating enzyme required for sulfatase activity
VLSQPPSVGQIEKVTVNGVTFTMAPIPAGIFMMGSPDQEYGREANEGPARKVMVKAFWMGQHEVTQALYTAVMGGNPSSCQGLFTGCEETHPVEQVSWFDAVAFTEKLSQLTGKRYRLPSEAEWEYAARGGNSQPYPWGFQASREYANYGQDTCCAGGTGGRDKWVNTSPVGQFAPNAFGLYDTSGNVWEWVQDCYGPLKEAPLDGSAKESQECLLRTLRGGSAYDPPHKTRSAQRGWYDPAFRLGRFFGFRLARDP